MAGDTIQIPIEVSGADRAQLQFEQVIDSLDGMARKILDLGAKSDEGGRRIMDLVGAFHAGEVSAIELRNRLTALAGALPATAQELKESADAAKKLADDAAKAGRVMAENTAKGLRDMKEEARKASAGTRELSVSLRGVGEAARHINEVRELFVSIARGALESARGVATLAAEQERLSAHGARLSLDFQQASDSAGGFVSEIQTMQLATSLANRGIRVTQDELNALSRIGMARARDAGKNVGEVFDSIADSVVEGGEELEKFGSSLHSVADSSHAPVERLNALVQRGRETATTMRDASDNVARFENDVRRAGRTMGTAFVDEFVRLQALGRPLRDTKDDAEELNRTLSAAGSTAASVVLRVGRGIGFVFGAVASGIAGMITGIAMLAASAEAIARRQGIAGARAAAARAQQEWTGAGSVTRSLVEFTTEQYRRLGAMGDDADVGRRTAAPTSASRADAGMVNTPAMLGIDPRTGRPIQSATRSSGGGGGLTASDARLAEIEAQIAIAQRMGGAQRDAAFGVGGASVFGGVEFGRTTGKATIDRQIGSTYEMEVGSIALRAVDALNRFRRERVALLRGQMGERRRGENESARRARVARLRGQVDEAEREIETAERAEATAVVREFVQRQAPGRAQGEEVARGLTGRARESLQKDRETQQEARERDADRSPEAAKAEMDKERGNRREARELDERRDSYRTFTDEMERLSGRRVNAAREEAEFVNSSFQSMGKAFSTHLNAVIEGKEELGVALQGMLADTLSAISQEASIKAGLYLAEGFAALATYRYDAAAASFAAAGIFTAVAVGTGVVGKAIAPSPSSESGGGSGSSKERDRSAAPMAAGSTTSGGPTVINVAFNGPQFGTGGVVQAARQLAGVINQGALQGGVQINRLAVGVGASG